MAGQASKKTLKRFAPFDGLRAGLCLPCSGLTPSVDAGLNLNCEIRIMLATAPGWFGFCHLPALLAFVQAIIR